MTREQRRDLFEAVGLTAIVASLIFLALQIQQANLATRIAARDLATQGLIEQLRESSDPEILAVAYQKSWTTEAITDLERDQVYGYHLRRWWNFERIYYLYREGVISEQEWRGFKAAMLGSLTSPNRHWEISRDAWRNSRRFQSEDFVAYVDNEIKVVK